MERSGTKVLEKRQLARQRPWGYLETGKVMATRAVVVRELEGFAVVQAVAFQVTAGCCPGWKQRCG